MSWKSIKVYKSREDIFCVYLWSIIINNIIDEEDDVKKALIFRYIENTKPFLEIEKILA